MAIHRFCDRFGHDVPMPAVLDLPPRDWRPHRLLSLLASNHVAPSMFISGGMRPLCFPLIEHVHCLAESQRYRNPTPVFRSRFLETSRPARNQKGSRTVYWARCCQLTGSSRLLAQRYQLLMAWEHRRSLYVLDARALLFSFESQIAKHDNEKEGGDARHNDF